MKKIAAYIIVFILVVQAVFAETVSPVSTDIRVFIDGKKIPAVCVYNTMYIAADDLIYFGYNLKYDESIRTLFLNKTGMKNDEEVPECSVTNLEKTDINLVINGCKAYGTTLYAANGKLYVSVSYLAYERDGNDVTQPKKGNYFGMEQRWDESIRALEITSAELPSKEEQIEKYVKETAEDPAYSFLSWSEVWHFKGSSFDVVKCAQGGTPHGTYCYTKYFADNGVSASLDEVYRLYGFYDTWGHMLTSNEELKDDKLYFDGHKTDGRTGRYYVDFETLAVITVEETEPDNSKRTVPNYESPIGVIPQKASFKTVMNGTEIPAWVILNGTYIDADLLLNFGFEKTYLNERTVSYVKTGNKAYYGARDIAERTKMYMGPAVYINGNSIATLNTENFNLISTENWTKFFDKGTFTAEWDAENNTLVLNEREKMFDSFEEAEQYAKEYYNGDDGNERIIYSGADFSILFCPSENGTEIFKIGSDYSVCCITELLMNVYSVGLESDDGVTVSEDGKTLEFISNGIRFVLDLYNYTLIF